MKFTLIIATVNRAEPLVRCLDSLVTQTYRDFDIIIADQNPDDRLRPVVERFNASLRITHLRTGGGVSAARNVALRRATGELINFPDDDCWYAPDTLERLAAVYAAQPEIAGVASRVRGPDGQILMGMSDLAPGPVTKSNAFWRCNTNVLSVRRDALLHVGGFDENLGPGNGKPWGSAEDVDLALRVIEAGHPIVYAPDEFIVSHGTYDYASDPNAVSRALSYGRGCGGVMRRHHLGIFFITYMVGRPLAAAAVSLLRGRFRKAVWYFAMFQGRLQGVVSRPIDLRGTAGSATSYSQSNPTLSGAHPS